jgi:hypothetical protein
MHYPPAESLPLHLLTQIATHLYRPDYGSRSFQATKMHRPLIDQFPCHLVTQFACLQRLADFPAHYRPMPTAIQRSVVAPHRRHWRMQTAMRPNQTDCHSRRFPLVKMRWRVIDRNPHRWRTRTVRPRRRVGRPSRHCPMARAKPHRLAGPRRCPSLNPMHLRWIDCQARWCRQLKEMDLHWMSRLTEYLKKPTAIERLISWAAKNSLVLTALRRRTIGSPLHHWMRLIVARRHSPAHSSRRSMMALTANRLLSLLPPRRLRTGRRMLPPPLTNHLTAPWPDFHSSQLSRCPMRPVIRQQSLIHSPLKRSAIPQMDYYLTRHLSMQSARRLRLIVRQVRPTPVAHSSRRWTEKIEMHRNSKDCHSDSGWPTPMVPHLSLVDFRLHLFPATRMRCSQIDSLPFHWMKPTARRRCPVDLRAHYCPPLIAIQRLSVAQRRSCLPVRTAMRQSRTDFRSRRFPLAKMCPHWIDPNSRCSPIPIEMSPKPADCRLHRFPLLRQRCQMVDWCLCHWRMPTVTCRSSVDYRWRSLPMLQMRCQGIGRSSRHPLMLTVSSRCWLDCQANRSPMRRATPRRLIVPRRLRALSSKRLRWTDCRARSFLEPTRMCWRWMFHPTRRLKLPRVMRY